MGGGGVLCMSRSSEEFLENSQIDNFYSTFCFYLAEDTLFSLSLLLSVNTLRVPFRFGSLGLSGRKLQLTCDDHYESIQFSPEVTLRLMRDALLLPISSHSWNFSHLFFLFSVFRSLPAGRTMSINAFGDKSV